MSENNGNKPAEVVGDGAKEIVNRFVLVLDLDMATNLVQVKGNIADVARCYMVLAMAKDAIREWNRMNNGYLQAEPVKKPSIIDKAKGAFGGK